MSYRRAPLSSARKAAAALGVLALAASFQAASSAAPSGRLVAVRFWSLGEVTRIALETDSEIQYHSDRVPNPDRIFFDLRGIKPKTPRRGVQSIPVGDKLLKQIRIAETQPGITRIVLDVEGDVEFSASQLTVPDRLIIELRVAGKAAVTPPVKSVTGGRTLPVEPAAPEPAAPKPELPSPRAETRPPESNLGTPKPETGKTAENENPEASKAVPVSTASRPPESAKPRPQSPPAPPIAISPEPKPSARAADEPGSAATAKRDSRGGQSLIRALGLKIGRVVLDPGHGGHDTGSIGPGGLAEKDLVLDVAKRLGALISKNLGSEVVYTRSDDTFVPLETRTALANEKKADLFLSIHANSSRSKNISGPETFYLSLNATVAEMEVAALENATSQRSVYELQELVQKIAKKEKVQESREFAASVQKALYAGLRPSPKNRGVKKAPFVVLIGAHMPSVLAEIAFLSNPKEEKLLKRPDYRQRIAEALFKGLAQYANTLSHFEVAQTEM